MSKHTGNVPLQIGTKKLNIKFDYAALSALDENCTRDDLENLNRIPIAKLVKILVIGLAANHPEIDEDWVMAESPPVADLAKAIDHALLFARFGPATAEQIIEKMKELEEAAKTAANKKAPATAPAAKAGKAAKKKTG